MNTSKRLYRSTQDRMFAGVCGGIAEYLDVDPTLVRLVFVALTAISTVSMLIVYVVLTLIVPEHPETEYQPDDMTESFVRSSIPVPDHKADEATH